MSEEKAQARHSCRGNPGPRGLAPVRRPGRGGRTRLCTGPRSVLSTRDQHHGREESATTTAVPRGPREPPTVEDGAWWAGVARLQDLLQAL